LPFIDFSGHVTSWVGDGVASIDMQTHFHLPERRDFSLPPMRSRGTGSFVAYRLTDEGAFAMDRPEFYRFHQGEKSLPFSSHEYETRLSLLRANMLEAGVDACVFTSMHNVAYFSGFLFCAFGRPYALVVTQADCVTMSAGIDASQPWRRSHGDNITYTDWKRHNYWRAVFSVTGTGRTIGYEADHLTVAQRSLLVEFLSPKEMVDVAPATMRQRMHKSAAEIELIRSCAQVADVGGYAIKGAIKAGTREIDVAMAGRDAMELEIAKRFPDAEYRDTWVWFQSGINTDGAHNPVTSRVLQTGDILSLNAFPMISGYYTALERTMFVETVDSASLKIWEANVAAHEYGMSLLKPGASCAEVTEKINAFFEERDLLQYRTFGYGHSFGILSHYYGREAGLELREDIDTVLEAGMVISMEPMLTLPEGVAGAGGYREHDILVINEDGNENITRYPYGPEFNVIA
jgi:creatinase